MSDELSEQRVELVREYFHKVEARDPSLLEMYTDDVQLYFPKFGLGHGKQVMAAFAARLGSGLEWLAHDIDKLHILVAGDHVVVKGSEWDQTRSGQRWPDRVVSTDRSLTGYGFTSGESDATPAGRSGCWRCRGRGGLVGRR